MTDIKIEVKPKTEGIIIDKVQKPKLSIDPQTAVVVASILSKIAFSETVKKLLIKLVIFGFGIFCGIGIVYKSGLPLPSEQKNASVSSYQKRIEELKHENAELKRSLDENTMPDLKIILPNFTIPELPQLGFVIPLN